ncbi:polyhydroxyalkanoate synthase [Plasticicumulans lactativorans]|uniref:Polyhydroxyalkanoate synthase n=1 Tax=Plasticicumulans lactativorans TaxID=1133106 RepID=A0A4R2LA25_9GAMM|nr:alpha/beta hydrolase [Plasticicumulans lactativorans]TCO81026.1 polyhydroxyalkanoate synthase [Plasticicumulans lactativorans]
MTATETPPAAAALDPFGIGRACQDTAAAWLAHPGALAASLTRLGTDLLAVQCQHWRHLLGAESADVVSAIAFDERFQDPAWTRHPGFDALKQLYLLQTRWLQDAIFATPGLDPRTARRAAFWVRQWLDALAPSNCLWTNPVALQRCVESGGKSLTRGFAHFTRDLAAGDVRMVEPDAFAIGSDLATTPGRVVYRNELLEVIQYAPTTARVRSVPLVLIAPWINKYYILDLRPHNSLVRHLVAQGFTVFVTSWKNPGPALRDTGFDAYLLRGALAAVAAARAVCSVEQVHAAGYCLGGTTLASLMAWCAADPAGAAPVAHWTLFTTLTDFADPGEIAVFLSDEAVDFIERGMAAKGYLDGAEMARSFRLLRPNSLIWHYVVHGYLYGEELPPFDILFWNMDTTRMPAAMHGWYLRELYLRNRLAQPGALELGGRRLDLGRITQPLYAVGCEQDHIAPWQQTFRTCALVGGPVRYVLATSGHILGIINPPVDPPKRRYWVGDAGGQRDAEAWRSATPKVPGSWWDDWTAWLHARCGDWRDAVPLDADLPAAPGSYVREG